MMILAEKISMKLTDFLISAGCGKFYEMCSLPEARVENYSNKKHAEKLLQFNRHQLCRVYPQGTRINSSNYDPVPLWNNGCQMIALNYQTPDTAMQLNTARFKVSDGNEEKMGFEE